MGHGDDRQARVGRRDDLQRPVKLVVVRGQVGHVVRGLPRLQGAAAFAQVQGVEHEAPGGEEVGQVRLEEVVGEAVDVQGGAARGFAVGGIAADEDRLDAALSVRVGPEIEDMLAVAGSEDVRFPLKLVHRAECYW